MKKLFTILVIFLSISAFAERNIFNEIENKRDLYYDINAKYKISDTLKMENVWSWFAVECDESAYSFDYCEETNSVIFCRSFVKFETKAEVHIFMIYKINKNKKILVSNKNCRISVVFVFDDVRIKYDNGKAIEQLIKIVSDSDEDVDIEEYKGE